MLFASAHALELPRKPEVPSFTDRVRGVMLSDPAEAYELIAERLEVAEELSAFERAEAWWLRAEADMRLGDYAAGLEAASRAGNALADAPERDPSLEGRIFLAKGRIDRLLGQHAEAIRDLTRAESLFVEAQTPRLEAMTLQELGAIHADAHDYLTAIEYYDRAEARYNGDAGVAVATTNNRADILKEIGRHDAARRDYKLALGYAEELGSVTFSGQVLANLALLEAAAGEPDLAERYFAEAKAVLEGVRLPRHEAYLASVAAKIAHARGDVEETVQHLDVVFEGSDLSATAPENYRDHELAAVTYAALGDYERAFRHREAQRRIDAQTWNTATSTLLAANTARHRNAEEQLAIEQLKNDQLRQAADLAEARRRQQRQAQIIMISAFLTLTVGAAAIGIGLAKRRLARANTQLSHTVGQLHEEVEHRRLAEEKLVEAKDKAEKANSAKSTFLATMSHELRTPMNGILGFADVLLADDLRENQREQLEIIRSSGHSLLTLINDILDLSQIEAGALKLRVGPFNPRKMTEAATQLLRAKAQEKNLSFFCHVDPEVPELAHGDEDRIRQVLINLVGNAIKFTSAGAVAVHLERADDQRELRFTVSDTGYGIPAEKKEALFQRYTRVEEGEAAGHEGTGLGLSICRELVSAMKGRIVCHSEPGEGSVFIVSIPLLSADAQCVTPIDRRAEGLVIAVIDDREVSRQAMTTMLRAEGAEVLHFDSGAASREELLALRSGGQKLDGVFVSQLIDKEAADKLKAGRSAASDADCLPFAYYGGTKDGGGEVYGSCSFRLSHPVLAQTVGEALHFIRGQRRSAALARVDSREPSAPAAAAAAPKHDKPVLIVDDVLANRKLAETVLQRAGYATVTASDGVEAEALASMRDYAVILMDVYMPNMDGKEATRRIRRSGGPNEDTVIIAVTASCTAVERQTILAAGIDAIVTKPVNFKELEETIEDILARRELAQSISDSQA